MPQLSTTSVTTDAARRSLRVIIVTALLACLFTWVPGAPRAMAADLFGNDVSWPQCSSTQSGYGLPMPADNSDFVIVGLTKGVAFSENPCLASQLKWATDRSKPTQAYTMAVFPTSTQISTYGTSGPYEGDSRVGQLANVGYAEGKYALDTLAKVNWKPNVVWIDVEPRSSQPWPGANTTQKLENRYVISGLARALRDAGIGFGGVFPKK